jgi:formate hydrogenlyase subunit 3/multisubunit Na+/H+ antiporter MnhD subunit
MLYIGALIVLHFWGESYEPGSREYTIASAASWCLIVLISLSAFAALFSMFWGSFGHYFKFKEKVRQEEIKRKIEEEAEEAKKLEE